MGLLDETISDARRSLPGASRGATGSRLEPAADRGWDAPADEPMEQAAPAAMETMFGFQKEEPPAVPAGLREAPCRLERMPAGSPLFVESEVGKPDLSAMDVKDDVISVMGDNRGNELATGHVNHGSPGKRTAASVTAESKTRQPVVVSEPIETALDHDTQKSRPPEGIARCVSEREETHQSRVSGQGAPSDVFAAPITPLRSETPGPTAARHSENSGRLRTLAAAVPGRAAAVSNGDVADGPPQGVESAAGPERSNDREPSAASPALAFAEARSDNRSRRALETEAASPSANGPLPPADRRPGSTRAQSQPQPPGLVIGRIDVVVVAREQPANNPSGPAGRANSGFFSRNYLKRL